MKMKSNGSNALLKRAVRLPLKLRTSSSTGWRRLARRRYKIMVSEKLKQQQEVEGCTFRPRLLTEKSMNRTANTSHSRLIQE